MRNEHNKTWLPIAIIAGALAVWGGVLGLGAYWAPYGTNAGADLRKLLVLAATTGGFLFIWGLALVFSARRVRWQKKQAPQKDQTSTS